MSCWASHIKRGKLRRTNQKVASGNLHAPGQDVDISGLGNASDIVEVGLKHLLGLPAQLSLGG